MRTLRPVDRAGRIRWVFERFTERARQVVVLASEESRMLKHDHIGTEHILMGFVHERDGTAARVLDSLGVTLERTRDQVVMLVGLGEADPSRQIPFTPEAKQVLERSLDEALSLGHNYIGTEHMLLGLVGVDETNVAAQILAALDVDRDQVRREVIGLLSAPAERQAHGDESPGRNGARHPTDHAWLDGLGAHLNSLAREIRRQLGREPDSADLLIALACASDTPAAHVLRELGVAPDSVAGAIARVRAETAERPRDRSRQAHDDGVLPPEDLREIHRHLGLTPYASTPDA
jgi:ATP-dependent Clp protease ATP-binding subunit ClpA